MKLKQFLVCSSVILSTFATAQTPQFDEKFVEGFQYRNLGPYRAGAWVVDFAVPSGQKLDDKYTYYVAARNGGVWKTSNNGATYSPIFDNYGTNSIGDIAVAPSNSDVVWVGTGEVSNARSSYAGNGIYKSDDAGKSFKCMGLEKTQHIARMQIHPKNPDVVYVAAMGSLFSANEDRGVYKTTDGGKTWEKVLFINDQIGFIDLKMQNNDPNVLYAAAYDKRRYPWHYEAGGPETAIYKTVDGGKTWNKLTNGLPIGNVGRIGIDIFQKDPSIVYAVVENLDMRPPTEKEATVDKKNGKEPQDRVKGGEVYKSYDAGASWKKVNRVEDNVGGKAAYSFNQIFVDPNNSEKVYVTTICLASSDDGGKTWHDIGWPARHKFTNMFGDVRTFWVDPQDSRHMLIGSDGGVYVSYDEGTTTRHHYNIHLGEFYSVEVDMEEPYNVYFGLQDHEAWKAPVNSWSGALTLEDWVIAGLWDGMYTKVDRQNSRWAYITSQFGFHHRVDQHRGERTFIDPNKGLDEKKYRYTWTTPIIISPHNSDVLYTGGQMLLKSTDKGDTWTEISKDLTDNDAEKIAGKGHMMYCSMTTLCESPIQQGVIWIGTDDGHLHLTKDGGKTWEEMTEKLNVLGCPQERYVSRIFASNHNAGTAYVTKSGYRNDDFTPYVFKTTDFGKTWTRISSNLPAAPVSVIVEDHKNPNLLFVGTDIGVYVSINQGASWVNMNNNIPVVPVRDLTIHPRENDLVVGTYGRGGFITDISALQELNENVLSEKFKLFAVESKPQMNSSQQRNWGPYPMQGDGHLTTKNEPDSLFVNYYLSKPSKKGVQVKMYAQDGTELASLEGGNEAGLNTVMIPTTDKEVGTYRITATAHKSTQETTVSIKDRYFWSVGTRAKKWDEIEKPIESRKE